MSRQAGSAAWLSSRLGNQAANVSAMRRAIARSLGCTPFQVSVCERWWEHGVALLEVNLPVPVPALRRCQTLPASYFPLSAGTPLSDALLSHLAAALGRLRPDLVCTTSASCQVGRPPLVSAERIADEVALNYLTPEDWCVFHFESAAARRQAYRRFLWCQSWLGSVCRDFDLTVRLREASPAGMALGHAAGL